MAPVGGASAVAAGTLSAAGAAASARPRPPGRSSSPSPHQFPVDEAAPEPVFVEPAGQARARAEKARTAGFVGSGPSSASVSVSGPVISLPVIAPRWPSL